MQTRLARLVAVHGRDPAELGDEHVLRLVDDHDRAVTTIASAASTESTRAIRLARVIMAVPEGAQAVSQ